MSKHVTGFLERLCDVIPPIMTAHGLTRRTCIAHTRLATIVARQAGIRAEPLACKLVILNDQAFVRAQELGRELAADDYEDGMWSLGIGYGQDPEQKGYDGHVVTVIERRWVLDLTLDQADRPQHNIHLRPGWFALPERFLSGEEGATGILDGTFLRYTAMPDDRGFLTVPDWVKLRPSDPIVRQVTAALNDRRRAA
jgi:hypothetical protein